MNGIILDSISPIIYLHLRTQRSQLLDFYSVWVNYSLILYFIVKQPFIILLIFFSTEYHKVNATVFIVLASFNFRSLFLRLMLFRLILDMSRQVLVIGQVRCLGRDTTVIIEIVEDYIVVTGLLNALGCSDTLVK